MDEGLLVVEGVGAEEAVAGVAQARERAAVGGEALVDVADREGDVGVGFREPVHPLPGPDDADDVNLRRAPPLQDLDYGGDGAARAHDRIEYERHRAVAPLGQAVVVLDR